MFLPFDLKTSRVISNPPLYDFTCCPELSRIVRVFTRHSMHIFSPIRRLCPIMHAQHCIGAHMENDVCTLADYYYQRN